MKLNYKRTILVGFAFFLICLFWQVYDNTIPLILTNKFGMSQTWSGVIMALDNVLALFLLPFFGALSDKCTAKRGKRTPFIVIGTIIAAVAFIGLSVVDNFQLTKIKDVSIDKYETSLEVIYEADPEVSFNGNDKKPLSEQFTKESFTSIKMFEEDGKTATSDYTDVVVPARNAYAWQKTVSDPATLIFFVLLLLVVLVSMGVFRSPAVALMPDVTPKPLRSKANAIINLMGSFGGITVLVLGIVFATGNAKNALMNYIPYFSLCAGIMIVALVVFVLAVKEPEWAKEADTINDKLDAEESDGSGDRKLSKSEKISLILILASVALWYMGYNAVTSKYSVYASSVLNMDYNLTLIIAQAAAIIAYIPVGIISSKIGRKKAILAGVVMLAAAFFAAAFLRSGSPVIVMDILFALAGIGWATINVNSYPMAVELAKGSNVGKYTGYYYTASMAAQVVTPVLSGVFLDINLKTLFPYATVFVALAFVTMIFVKHGDSVPEAKADVLENLDVDM